MNETCAAPKYGGRIVDNDGGERKRPPGVLLSCEELTDAVTDLESAVQATEARLAQACIPMPSSPQATNGHGIDKCPGRSQIAQRIATERERISLLTTRLRDIHAILDV